MTDSQTAAWDWICAWAREQGSGLGRVLIVRPDAETEVLALLAAHPQALVYQPFRVDHRRFEVAASGRVRAEMPEGPFDTVLCVPSRQRVESLGLMALALERLAPAGRFVFACANDQGAAGFLSRLRELVPELEADSKKRCRLAVLTREQIQNTTPLAMWKQEAGAQLLSEAGLSFSSEPGIYGWNKIDRGSELLVSTLPTLAGIGADLGAGYGYLSHAALTRGSTAIQSLHAVEADARAIACARENLVAWPQARFHWLDVVGESLSPVPVCDWILMNPPFHEGKQADPSLGNAFIKAAASRLKPQGGALYMVANAFLPYEDTLAKHFSKVERVLAADGFKVIHARR
jgi:16S rRNA (guanine1207-N2)-methyltransferase